jgi:hypothetical protein
MRMPLAPAFTLRPDSSSVELGHAGSGRHLSRDLQYVAEAVVVEASHGPEVFGEGVGLPRVQLLNQELDIGGNQFLFGAGVFLVVVGSMVVGVLMVICSLARLWRLHVRVERGMYMPNASWRRPGVASCGGPPHPWS